MDDASFRVLVRLRGTPHCAHCSVSDVATAMYQFFPVTGVEHKNLGSIRLLSLAMNSSKGSDAQCLEPRIRARLSMS